MALFRGAARGAVCGAVWGAGEGDGPWRRGVSFGHSVAFRGALDSVMGIMGCPSPKVSPPHCVRFLTRHPGATGLVAAGGVRA